MPVKRFFFLFMLINSFIGANVIKVLAKKKSILRESC